MFLFSFWLCYSPKKTEYIYSTLLTPLVLLSDLFLFLRGKIVLDVKGLSNFFRSLSLDHVCNSFAGEVKKWLNVEIVCSEDEFKKGCLIYSAEVLVPWNNVISSLLVLLLLSSCSWVLSVVLAVLNNFGEDLSSDIWEGNWSINSSIFFFSKKTIYFLKKRKIIYFYRRFFSNQERNSEDF